MHTVKRKEVIKMETKMYLDFIKEALKTDGIDVADIANKKALELKRITVDQYCQAARLIAKAFMAQ